jgi:hypothetical protein
MYIDEFKNILVIKINVMIHSVFIPKHQISTHYINCESDFTQFNKILIKSLLLAINNSSFSKLPIIPDIFNS